MPSPAFRAWGVRAAGNFHDVDPAVRDKVIALAKDAAPDVRLQVAIAACKLPGVQPIARAAEGAVGQSGDPLIPQIVWQNLHPLMEQQSGVLLEQLADETLRHQPAVSSLLPNLVERMLGSKNPDPAAVARLFILLTSGSQPNGEAAEKCLAMLAGKMQSREITGERSELLKKEFAKPLNAILSDSPTGPLHFDAALLATSWRDPAGIDAVRKAFAKPNLHGARAGCKRSMP